MISFVEERSTPQVASTGRGARAEPSGHPPATPAGSPFKLRLGVTHVGADAITGANPAAADTPSTGATPTSAATPVPCGEPISGSSPVVPTFASIRADVPRAGEWDEFPAAVHEDSRREYKSDSDFQAMIAALADQIAVHDGPRVPEPPSLDDPSCGSPSVVAPPDIAGPALVVARTPENAADVAPENAADVAADIAAASVSSSHDSPAAEVVETSADTTGAPLARLDVAPEDVAPTPVAPLILDELAEVEESDELVEVPEIVEAVPALPHTAVAAPPLSLPLGQASKRVVDRVSGSTEHEVIVPRPTPTLAGSSLLPKIEAQPDAPRPTKPVDFRSLLKEAGVPPAPAPVKRKRHRQRHPFRALLKLVVVVGLLGGALYVAKVRFLDTKWESAIEEIAHDVAGRRGLEWDHAVDVVTLPADEYALRLASSMLGIDSAETNVLAGEWRALGLTEGAVDLGAIGSAATADQPAFYDPADDTVYAVADMSDALRELSLSRALTNALLDQHHDWSGRLLTDGARASASTRLGVRALFDGDALAIRSDTVAAVLADPTIAKEVSDEIAGMRLSAAPLARGASPYAVALASQPGAAAQSLFTAEMTPAPRDRDTVEGLAITNDAAVFDALRGRAATAEVLAVPQSPGTTAATTPISAAPAAGAAPRVAAQATASPRGLVYWYYVLASRLGSDEAWRVALLWRGDATAVTATPAGVCVDAVIATRDAAEQDQFVAAFGRWAAAAPPASATSVTEPSDTSVGVRACDPGPTARTASNAVIPLFGAAPEELLVASELRGAGLPPNEQARTCVVEHLRRDGFPPLLRSTTVDSSLTDPTLDISSPQVRTLISGCASA